MENNITDIRTGWIMYALMRKYQADRNVVFSDRALDYGWPTVANIKNNLDRWYGE